MLRAERAGRSVAGGRLAAAVLARLVPINLRPGIFVTGHAARTVPGHMNCALMQVGDTRFETMVFGSMAGAAHDLKRAIRMVAARRMV
ncbi:hypothetical protein P6F26_03060 [Roseibacterium sp. SDUM158017]|uniref:hypothetical protein n=1 Tax=Roseicyclus salinarum TaxID=3036773 RepID=UPI0024155FDE|nr:hypothetical protein [Roseibacterium sp. SDUM158017]MDG4647412.1 hypothetical protein [Roseibacterium sp. SDUM158017]